MTITALTDLSQLPDQSQDQDTFDNNWAYVLRNLRLRAQQENDLAAGMGISAAGGAFALAFVFDTATAAADPGVGKIRLGSAVQSSAVTAYVDNSIVGGQDATATLAAWTASTSPTKGYLKFVKQGDASKWLLFKLTAATPATGYYVLTLAPVTASAASPFASGDTLIAQFTPTGDAGIPGAFPTFRVQHQTAAGASAGGSAAGTQTRVLNTVATNTLTGASLASNQMTLPAGKYRVTGSAPAAAVSTHQAYLYNVTANSYPLVGTSETVGTSNQSRSILVGEITLAVASVLELRHYIFTAVASSGLGVATPSYGQPYNLFAELVFEKVA